MAEYYYDYDCDEYSDDTVGLYQEPQTSRSADGDEHDCTHSDDDDDSDDESFGLHLSRTGPKSGYYTQNDPQDRYQRETVTERIGAVDIRCKSMVTVHGYLNNESSDYATLLVYDLSFNTHGRFSRIAFADVKFTFRSSVHNVPGPEVREIAPYGFYTMEETKDAITLEDETEVSGQGGHGGVTFGLAKRWGKTISREETHNTRLKGDTICHKFGKETGANFLLHENEATRSGVPAWLRVAILLSRREDDEFECEFDIYYQPDWKTRFFASKGKRDDPIYFNPALPPKNKLRKQLPDLEIDKNNLEATRLDRIFDVTTNTVFENPVKHFANNTEKERKKG